MNRVNRAGFTLIELLIVVAIIGILAAIAIPNFNQAQVRSKVAKSQAEMRAIETAVEAYQVDNAVYPTGSLGFVIPGSSIYNERLRVLTTPISYLSSLPVDPFNPGGGLDYSADARGVTTYDYNSYEALIVIWTGNGSSLQQANDTWNRYYGSSAWKLVGIGPNQRFADDDWGGVKYDPTNGTHSDGDIVLSQAYRFDN